MGEEINLPSYDNPPEEARVRALICSDDKGQIQVIAPESAIVDPTPINEATARTVRGLPTAPEQPVCAIPGFYQMPSVVHSELKHLNAVALATEVPGRYVRASGVKFQELCSNHVSYEAQFNKHLAGTPASTADDIASIERAVDEFTLRRIEARLDETLHIPPLPDAARRLLALRGDPNFDLADLVSIVETDPSLAARIIGWANSPLYKTPNPVNSLGDAIMRVLGFDTVFNMALGLAVGSMLNLPASHVSGASPYWLTAVYSAAAMEALGHQVEAQQPDTGACYLAGLLSNFGTLVLGHVFPPQYEQICRIQEANPHLHHTHVDQHVLGLNREVVAASLMELWEVPEAVRTAVRFQHVQDYTGEHETYVHLLRLAHKLIEAPLPDEPAAIVLPPDWLDCADRAGVSEHGLMLVAETLRSSKAELGDLADLMMP